MSKINNTFAQYMRVQENTKNNTFIHKINPAVKILITLLYIITVLSCNKYDYITLIFLAFYPIFAISLADISAKVVLKWASAALPFSFFAGIFNVFYDTAPMIVFQSFQVSFGMVSCLVILIKTFLCVSSVLILAMTTQIWDIISTLSAMKVPDILILQIMMMVRYIGLLLSQVSNVRKAYMLRLGVSRGIAIKDMGGVAGSVFVQSYERADRVYHAMMLRGFDGSYRGGKLARPSMRDICYFTVNVVLFIVTRSFL